MTRDERTPLGLAIALVTLILLAVAYVSPWWTFEESTGRRNAPDGPQDDPGTQRTDVTFYPQGWQGDAQVSDVSAAERATSTLRISLLVAGGALALYVLGQVPGVSRIVTRPMCMVLGAVATLGVAAALVVGWVYVPGSMAARDVSTPFTSFLYDGGYIRTWLQLGWAVACLAVVGAISCLLAAYSAGNAKPSVIEEYRAVA